MVKNLTVFLVFGLFVVFSCRKKTDNEYPVITVYSPLDNSQYTSGSFLRVKALIRGDERIKKVFLQLLDEKYGVVSEQKEVGFDDKEIDFSDSIYLDTKTIKASGGYIVKIRAWDGELLTNEYVPVKINVGESRVYKTVIITKTSSNKFYFFESGVLIYKNSYNGDMNGASFPDSNHVFFATYNPGNVTSLKLSDGMQQSSTNSSDCSTPFCWSSLTSLGKKVHCYNNGTKNLFKFENDLISQMYYPAIQAPVEEMAVSETYWAVEERINASALPVNIRFINLATGSSVQNVQENGDILKMYWRANELLVFAVKDNTLLIEKADFTNAVALKYTSRNIINPEVYAERKSDTEYFLHYDGKLWLYSTIDNSILPLQTIDIDGMSYDTYNKRLFLFKSTFLYWLDDDSETLHELQLTEEITAVCPELF